MDPFLFKKVKPQYYSEIPQQSVITFSLALQQPGSNEIEEKFYRFKCRDFFNEIVWKQWTGKNYPIYSFSTNNFPVVKDEIIYLCCYGVSKDLFPKLKDALETFDTNLEVSSIDDVVLVKMPKIYILYTFLISYLSFYIRCVELFPDSPFDPDTGNEGDYAKSIKYMTNKSMQDVYDAFKEFVTDTKYHFQDHCGNAGNINDVYENHNQTGIRAVLTNPQNLFRKFCDEFWNRETV